jgi:CRP/FNR family transcriptional regulator, cyclic AMP receptor protein
MSNFDFTIPPSKRNYDAQVALRSFESAGATKNVAAGKTLFVENKRSNPLFLQRDKMYCLLEGEVDLSVNKTRVGAVRKGEIFGEMTLITKMPRTATAKAKTDCRLITLDKDQLQTALRTAPEFGLLLMSIMITRLRDTIARSSASGARAGDEVLKDSALFDKKLLGQLADELDDSARIRYPADKVIMQEGQAGVFMYVVLKGRVEIAIHNSVVGRIGPGGVFGEMALITQAERVASAVAKTDCELLAINRNVFLDLVRANPKFAVSLLSAVGNRARFMASVRA